jgi:hypothetical protein
MHFFKYQQLQDTHTHTHPSPVYKITTSLKYLLPIYKYNFNKSSDLPINALGIGIFNHVLSLISSPESGWAMAFTTVAMSVLIERFRSSNPKITQQNTSVYTYTRFTPVTHTCINFNQWQITNSNRTRALCHPITIKAMHLHLTAYMADTHFWSNGNKKKTFKISFSESSLSVLSKIYVHLKNRSSTLPSVL